MGCRSNAWRKIQKPRITWGKYLKNITHDPYWGSMIEQVRNDLGISPLVRDCYGPRKHLWEPHPNIWVQTEHGRNIVVNPLEVENNHTDGKIEYFITVDGPMGHDFRYRVTKWKVAEP